MLKHTKIVATISDKRCDVDFINSLYKAGMNVVRLNTAHLTAEGLSRIPIRGPSLNGLVF